MSNKENTKSELTQQGMRLVNRFNHSVALHLFPLHGGDLSKNAKARFMGDDNVYVEVIIAPDLSVSIERNKRKIYLELATQEETYRLVKPKLTSIGDAKAIIGSMNTQMETMGLPAFRWAAGVASNSMGKVGPKETAAALSCADTAWSMSNKVSQTTHTAQQNARAALGLPEKW